jgi:hypothetical protein
VEEWFEVDYITITLIKRALVSIYIFICMHVSENEGFRTT